MFYKFGQNNKIIKKDLKFFPIGMIIGGLFTFLFYISNFNTENPFDAISLLGALIGLPVLIYIPDILIYVVGIMLVIKIKETIRNSAK